MSASRDVLVTRAWPRGVCPIHMLNGKRCTALCMSARYALAELEADYLAFWNELELAA